MEVGDEKNECKTNDALYGGKCNVQCGRDGVLPSGTGVFCGAVSGAGQRAGAARYDVHRNVCVYADGGSSKVCGGACRGDGSNPARGMGQRGVPLLYGGQYGSNYYHDPVGGGGLLEWKDQPGILAAALEGAFILGAVILFNRALHMILHWGRKAGVPERPDGGREERLMGYAESFQGLSQVFHSMSAAHQNGDAEELGQIQNELTGKICASCDACAVCWERDPAPLYGALSGILSAIWNGETPGEEKSRSLHSIAGTAAIWWRRRCASLSASA